MSAINTKDSIPNIPSKEVIQKLFDELYDLSFEHLNTPNTNKKLIYPQMEVNKVFMILIQKLLFYSYISCYTECESKDNLFKDCVKMLITKILEILTETIRIYTDISGNLNYENLFELYLSLLKDNFYYINYIVVYLNDFISKYIIFLEHSGGGNKYQKIINEKQLIKTIYECENTKKCKINGNCYDPNEMLKIKTLTMIQQINNCNDLLMDFNVNYPPQIVSQIILPIKEIYKNLQNLITVNIKNNYNTITNIGYILDNTCTYKLNEIKDFTQCGFETYIKNKIKKESSGILNLFKSSKIKNLNNFLNDNNNIKSVCYKFSDPNILESDV